MIYWFCYDITDDKARHRVSILCLRAGMHRVQYSVFAGKLTEKLKRELWAAIQPFIGNEDKCCLFRIGPEAFQEMEEYGQQVDKALIAETTMTFFF